MKSAKFELNSEFNTLLFLFKVSRNITVGIDVGTHTVKVVVAELIRGKDKPFPKVIGTGYAESKGLRHGYIMSPADAARSIKQAARQAEKVSGVQIKKAFLSIGGLGLAGSVSQSSVIVSRGDSEITDLDVKKVLEASENELPSSYAMNRKIIHAIPISYKIDGRIVLGRPQGMKGMKLESRTLFISCLEQHLNDLIQTLGDAGIEVEDVMAAPLASSLVSLSKTQKIAGCVLANIGAETVSIVVFENNIPISLEVFPIGSIDVTHDIALGLKVSLEEAEALKTGANTDTTVSKKKLEEIIDARLTDIFELIEGHLKKIGRSGLLPAGIILTGGGSGIADVEEIAKLALKLPAKTSHFPFEGDTRGLRQETWSVAYGLCILGFTQGDEPSLGIKIASRTTNKILAWIKQFLP
ncbi:MAG: cell division protein FtsA, cell division protein FtsA [Candidatus Paceibacter sp.]|jgi:cell division protein FtsA|nr:cell division protein FtsA, cell division protein FtsA [Candidatus Paceibacter sp.]